MSCSLMKDQMTLVISSPSSSTIGFLTSIFPMGGRVLSIADNMGIPARCYRPARDGLRGTTADPPAQPRSGGAGSWETGIGIGAPRCRHLRSGGLPS